MSDHSIAGPCGCGCDGATGLTPLEVANPPQLDRLAYRAGTHARFLQTMRARLRETLPALHTGDPDDPAIAFLDAWAVIADVLTFYQERIANEGYLRTATERRSVLELSRLVGHRPRPGVAASVFLAFTLEDGYRGKVPAGTRAQSVPAPGELAQPYETGGDLAARAEWNLLRPRLTRPQALSAVLAPAADKGPLCLDSTQTGLEPNDPLLLDSGGTGQQLFRVRTVTPDPAADRTAVDVEPWTVQRDGGTRPAPEPGEFLGRARRIIGDGIDVWARRSRLGPAEQRIVELLRSSLDRLDRPVALPDLQVLLEQWVLPVLRTERHRSATVRRRSERFAPALEELAGQLAERETRAPGFRGVAELAHALARPASVPPTDPRRMPRNPGDTFAATGDALPRLLSAVRPDLGAVLYEAWQNLPRTDPPGERLYALRTRARLFGHNAPPRAAEKFTVVFPRTSGAEALLTYTVTIAGHSLTATARANATSTARFDAASETVETTLSGFSQELAHPVAVIVLKQRRVTVTAHLRPAEPLRVECVGSDPTTVVRTLTDDNGVAAAAPPADLTVSGEIQAEFPLREQPRAITLDASYPQILPGSWIALERTVGQGLPALLITKVLTVRDVSRADYGVTATGTQLVLAHDWFGEGDSFTVVRDVTVHAQSEPLAPAPAPLDPITEAICGDRIELDGLYGGLEAGRRVIVSGERTDVPGVTGLRAAELAMVTSVEQIAEDELPGETTHSVLRLANPLAYCYRLDTARIHGNVADASHGETRAEVLGSGDAGIAAQRFELRQTPLTYVSAPTTTGTESTLRVRVDDILWHETSTPAEAGPSDHSYSTATDEDQHTSLLFGDGRRGARLPSGVENVTALYRTGIGRSGNVPAGRISLLATRPLGVRDVVNPLPATGGADRDGRDQVRRDAPLGVRALDRLVSVTDHEDFARTFAGIGKAAAVRLSDGRRELVHVTVAGVDDIPIAATSDLHGNLVQALHRFGDPHRAVQVAVRELLSLIVGGQVRVAPDHRWESVEPKVRAALVSTLGFDRRELGQDVLLSEVLTVIQGVEGVDYADIDIFTAVDEADLVAALALPDGLAGLLTLNQRVRALPARVDRSVADPERRIRPAQLAVIDPRVPDTLLLTERTT